MLHSSDEARLPELPDSNGITTPSYIHHLKLSVEGEQDVSDDIFQGINKLKKYITTQCIQFKLQ